MCRVHGADWKFRVQVADQEELEAKARVNGDGEGEGEQDHDSGLDGPASKVRRVDRASAAWKSMQQERQEKQDAKIRKKESKASKAASKKRKAADAEDALRAPDSADASTAPVGPVHVGKDGVKTLGLSEALNFDATIRSVGAKGEIVDSREKHALDDFLLALDFARSNVPFTIGEEEFLQTRQFLISMFLELAWSTRVNLNGKQFTVYSAFRNEAQRLLPLCWNEFVLSSGQEVFRQAHHES